MRENYKWAGSSYNLILENNEIKNYNNVDCFTGLRDYKNKNNPIKYIRISNLNCKPSSYYTKLYLKYISDMLYLKETKIYKNSFKFKAYKCNKKNMLVLSLIRFLYENIGCKTPALKTEDLFFKPLLLTGKCKYRNKLKRFCWFYSNIGEFDYWHTGHSWKPSETKIKSTKDFINLKRLESVNEFFTNE